ncbi:hypothetical protein GCM10007160_21300 [Litchfieldella qijiaojingensis]|uniref:Uncharacterized protein n=1 Tax=Litchfieldella qijiaojingensis TaxID=980347 RepID=A0ABQ2YU64_9GAMM|nr:hypothetical protein [Halomonas qijiaojingensis]GGX93462.1 hypothetical protein GCM10007160_21300 [Halomonas qijiaojingensis]
MSATFLEIALSNDTLEQLKSSGYSLYVFLPVMSSNKSGVPLVWECRQNYLANTTITIPEANVGYISTDDIAKNRSISIGSQASVSCGQMLTVSATGTLSESASQLPGIYFTNDSSTSYRCGLARQASEDLVPYCAFNLSAKLTVSCALVDAAFVFFATSTYDPGTYLEASLGQGIYLETQPGGTTTATFDLGNGWSAMTDGRSSTIVPQGANLVETLIQRPSHNQPCRLASPHPLERN